MYMHAYIFIPISEGQKDQFVMLANYADLPPPYDINQSCLSIHCIYVACGDGFGPGFPDLDAKINDKKFSGS